MFEPVHGSAPEIAVRPIAGPTPAVVIMTFSLNHHGLETVAKKSATLQPQTLLGPLDIKSSSLLAQLQQSLGFCFWKV